MPWEIRKADNKFCVHNSDTDELVKCHSQRSDAVTHMAALYANVPEGKQPASVQITTEAKVEKKTGREWEVTIIGAHKPDELLVINGRQFIVSDNGRLYDTKALAAGVDKWEGVKVYDNHLTEEEFNRKQGMRSPVTEWLGTLVRPRWDAAKAQLRATFKIVEEKLAAKMVAAHEQGILSTIGLSIDTAPVWGTEIFHKGQRFPVIEGFKLIRSVDLVADPAAGGRFERLIASRQYDKEINIMSEDSDNVFTLDDVEELVNAKLADALAAREAEEDNEIEDMGNEDIKDELEDRELSKAELELQKVERKAKEARRETDLARTELMIERKLERAKLPEKFEDAIRSQFDNRIVESEIVDKAITQLKAAQASLDTSGRVKVGGAHEITVGLVEQDRLELEFARLLMGNTDFRKLEHAEDETVQDRIADSTAYQSWIKAGKPDLPQYPRISSLLYDYFGGDPLLSGRALEAATTSTLTTAVKNTVNIMTANAYSQRERWFEPLVRIEEVDTIDDSTLARVYGVNALSVVEEGAAYTELAIADDEETAAFVKRGNYIGITLEVLMRDKINFVRRIPQVLADTWFNTLSDLVSNVFTINAAAGPTLADTGALFNATALTSAGGHANLLTTALSHAEFSVVRTAMQKQFDQALGVGRKLLLQPRFLLVPVDLEVAALDIRNSELVPGADFDTADGGAQTVNNFRGQFEVIVVPTWTDVNDWALVADPAVSPAIWLIYPRGQRTPQIFSADGENSAAMFTNDELRFKVRMMSYRFSATDDCAPVSDFRALHKSNV